MNRRDFLKGCSTGTLGLCFGSSIGYVHSTSPNDKLRIGVIGVGNRAASNISGVKSQDIVALCDIDETFLSAAGIQYPRARRYHDFRKMIDAGGLDAVVISTADHTHAAATVMALKAGLHVYCEKPLTHTVAEARLVAETAAKAGKATQMGNQIHASNNYRRVVELVQSNAIGTVREVHVWCDKNWGGGKRPTESPAVPKSLHYDLWLGPARHRPYHPTYLPVNWRRFWDFGNGTLGDMGCHYMDLAFWALKLKHPTTVEARGPAVNEETAPEWLVVDYEFPVTADQKPLRVSWYDGGKKPKLTETGQAPAWKNGVLFVGDKGLLIADYSKHRLLPENKYVDFQAPPQFIPNSSGHYHEWIHACKTGASTTCNFSYAGALTEAVLLGTVAYRAGQKLEWDGENCRVKNDSRAMDFVERHSRTGWKIS